MHKFIVILLALLMTISAGAAYAQNAGTDQTRRITVTGEAQVNVVPDEVAVSVGVQTCGDSAEEARTKEDAIAKKVIAVADTLKIDRRNVQTDNLEIDLVKPEYYDWRVCVEDKDPRRYGARQMIRFTLKDVSKLEHLLTGTLEAGAIRIIGVDFKTTELRKYRDMARAMAIKAAKEKATAMAAGLDQRIGRPIAITEQPNSGRDWYYYGSWWWGGGYGSSSANSVQNVVSAPGQPNAEGVALGQISVKAGVTVSFELE